jgi:DNA-binding LacI/PurR family transcriptional regulator
MAVFAMPTGSGRTLSQVLEEVKRFRPHAVGYAAMYHKLVELPDELAASVQVMINCREHKRRATSIVPDEEQAAHDLTNHLLRRGRRRIAFISLPGLLADELRCQAIKCTLEGAGLELRPDWIRPAVRRSIYNDRAPSLVSKHIENLIARQPTPDAIICGNDRVAMDVYFALYRAGVVIPDDIAVVSFDNQVEIASRLDPPLTTMALPHRAMGRIAAEILLSDARQTNEVIKLPFDLIERASV